MLNYLNKCVYLPKMVPLKHWCRGGWDVWGIRGVQRGVWYDRGENEGSPAWEFLPMKLCMPPTVIVGGGKAGLFKLESW